MQSPTHFLTGILIYNLFRLIPGLSPWIYIPLTVILAIASHALLDCVAIMTYHPPEPQKQDKFWVIYHVLIYLTTFAMVLTAIIIHDLRNYLWVMVASILPDIIDWYTLRPIFKKGPVIHPTIDRIRNTLFFWIPKWNMKKWTVVFEFGLVAILVIGIWLTYPFQ